MLIMPVIVVLLGVQYADAQSLNLVTLVATMKPDNSNQFLHNQFTATLRHRLGFLTTDVSICPTGMKGLGTTGGCTYSLENGAWRPNSFNNEAYVLEGTLKATSQAGGNTNSKFFTMRADLTKASEQTTATGITVQNLTGTISFGNGVSDYSVMSSEFFPGNETLILVAAAQSP